MVILAKDPEGLNGFSMFTRPLLDTEQTSAINCTRSWNKLTVISERWYHFNERGKQVYRGSCNGL